MRYLIIPAAVLMFLAGYYLGIMTPKFSNMKSEYGTARVIASVKEFVIKNDGKWPHSWADLKMNDDGLTIVNFSIDTRTCDRFEIANAINTKNGRWYTYPHYREQMDDLWETVSKARVK